MLFNGLELEHALSLHKKRWGDKELERGIDHCLEEMAELAVTLLHFRRGRCGQDRVLEEMADVLFNFEIIGRKFSANYREMDARIEAAGMLMAKKLEAAKTDAESLL